jgi:NAD(P)H dehydrogenase (quinone)
MSIIIPYFSKSGHTKKLAEHVLLGVKKFNDKASLIDVENMSDNNWLDLEEAKGIIWGSPTYMGSVAGEFKLFIDDLSDRGFWTEQKLMDKMAAGFTVATYPSGDKLNTLIQLSIFSAQHGMIWVNHNGTGSQVENDPDNKNQWGSWLGLSATSISDKSKLIDASDLKTAECFGERFARCTARWTQGNL